MKLLAASIFISFFALNSFSQNILMSHDFNMSSVYIENTNIRKEASIDAEIIGKGKKGDLLELRYERYKDTIDGIAGVWEKVAYNDGYGFVWGNLTSQSAAFKSQEYINHSFVIWENKNNQLEVKFSENNTYKETFLLPNTSGLRFYSAFSLGTTYNSNNNDVFVFYLGGYDSLIAKYYQWDGSKITPFNKVLKEDAFSRYNSLSEGVITENVVNLRTEPRLKSDVIKVLGLGYKVTPLKYEPVFDSINGKKGYWNQVAHNNDTGFVWANYLGHYSFNSYKDESLSFIFKQGEEDFDKTILAVKNGKIIDSYNFSSLSNFMGAHSRGNMGLKNISEIIGVCYTGGSCGTTSGDVLIPFDGEKFYKSFTEAGVGDGGLSYGENVIFPSNIGGEEGVINITTYDSESIDLPGENNYESINRSILTRKYVLKNDSLLEIDSETKRVENIVETNFPKYTLGYFEKGDINGDGFEDVVLYARYNTNDYEAYDLAQNKSLVAILLNDKKDKYTLHSYTNKLIYHNENDPLTAIKLIENGFKIDIYFSGYYNEQTNNNQYEVTFKYEKSKADFFMREINVQIPEGQEFIEKNYKYKSKNIAFKDSYIPEVEY